MKVLIGATLTLFIAQPVFATRASKHFDGLRLREHKAQVTVLEAPLFGEPNEKSPVIQYVRKGQEIYIHPAEFAQDRYKEIIDESAEEVAEYDDVYAMRYRDPLFDKEGAPYVPTSDSRFYKTMAKSGRDAYILKEHALLLTHDLREVGQTLANPDPTDYRIEEPLPKGFPIIQPSGYRGYFSIGLGIPSAASYSYTSRIQDTGFGFYKKFNFTWAKNADMEVTKRFFFGGMLTLNHFEIDYKLSDRESKERNLSLALGPFVSYDIWKEESFSFNVFGSIQFVFLDMLDVEQNATDGSGLSDSRSFNSYHFSPQAGMAFQKPKLLGPLDLLAGVNLDLELPRNYTTQDSAKQSSWWKGDEFDRPTNLQITYFLGLQSSY